MYLSARDPGKYLLTGHFKSKREREGEKKKNHLNWQKTFKIHDLYLFLIYFYVFWKIEFLQNQEDYINGKSQNIINVTMDTLLESGDNDWIIATVRCWGHLPFYDKA